MHTCGIQCITSSLVNPFHWVNTFSFLIWWKQIPREEKKCFFFFFSEGSWVLAHQKTHWTWNETIWTWIPALLLMTLGVWYVSSKHQFPTENKASGQDTLYRSPYLFLWSINRSIQTRNVIEDSCSHLIFWKTVLLMWKKTPTQCYTGLSLGGEGSGGLEPQVFRPAWLLGFLGYTAIMLSSSPTKLNGSSAWQYHLGTSEQNVIVRASKAPQQYFRQCEIYSKFR